MCKHNILIAFFMSFSIIYGILEYILWVLGYRSHEVKRMRQATDDKLVDIKILLNLKISGERFLANK